MSKFAAFLGDNAIEVDSKLQEQKLREKEPLLLDETETIELTFKGGRDGRDKHYFTSHRILLKDGKGIGHKRKNFQSYPYTAIEGFYIQTSGATFFDDDVELRVHCGGGGSIKIDMAKNSVNLFALQQFLSMKVLQHYNHSTQDDHDYVDCTKSDGSLKNLSSFFTGDATSYDAATIQNKFTTETPVLIKNEQVKLCFKTGRDFFIFTSERILLVDVQGLIGKKIKFQTVLWDTIKAAEIGTPGGLLDRDMEMKLYTDIEENPTIEIDFRKGKTDIWSVKKIISNMILGKDEKPIDNVQVSKGSSWSLGSFFDRDANRPIDASKMDRILHNDIPLLQGSEVCEVAFKGIRDMVVMTTKRIIIIDPRGISGTKKIYRSIPYKSITAFAIETSGHATTLDLDTEVMLWTDMVPIIPSDGDNNDRKPGMSFIELDFNKKLVDIIALKKYLSERCLKAAASKEESGDGSGRDSTSLVSSNAVAVAEVKETMIGNFFSYFSDNQRAINPKDIDKQLHTKTPLLLDTEIVVMAFKSGRDLTLFTNYRILVMDVQGVSGTRVSYRSTPYPSIKAFAVESAGSWDRDSELDLYTKNLWDLGKIQMDFRKGQVDILQIQKFLSAMVLHDKAEMTSYLEGAGSAPQVKSVAGLGGFINWLGGNSVEQNAAEMDKMFHSDPPLLMGSEKVEKVYKTGRDMFVYTTHRVLLVDVQGLRGRKVEYLSVPHSSIKGYEVETAGHMDRDAEVYIKMDIPEKKRIEQDILVKRGDVMEVQLHLTKKLVIE